MLLIPHPSPLIPYPSSPDLVGSLVEKSLVVQMGAADAEPRYTMLETIREFALEMLAAAGEDTTLRRRHRDWCLVLAEEVKPIERRVFDARRAGEISPDDTPGQIDEAEAKGIVTAEEADTLETARKLVPPDRMSPKRAKIKDEPPTPLFDGLM